MSEAAPKRESWRDRFLQLFPSHKQCPSCNGTGFVPDRLKSPLGR